MNEEKDCHVEPVRKSIDREALSSAESAYLNVQGMGCERCATRVQNSLLNLNGVLTADVELSLGTVEVKFVPKQVEAGDLLKAVASAGSDNNHHYQAQII